MRKIQFLLLSTIALALTSCSDNINSEEYVAADLYPNVSTKFAGKIDLNNPSNYANQGKPTYITKGNTAGNPITD